MLIPSALGLIAVAVPKPDRYPRDRHATVPRQGGLRHGAGGDSSFIPPEHPCGGRRAFGNLELTVLERLSTSTSLRSISLPQPSQAACVAAATLRCQQVADSGPGHSTPRANHRARHRQAALSRNPGFRPVGITADHVSLKQACPEHAP